MKETERLATLLPVLKPDGMFDPDSGVLDDVAPNRLGLVMMSPRHIRVSVPSVLTPGFVSERWMANQSPSSNAELWEFSLDPALGT